MKLQIVKRWTGNLKPKIKPQVENIDYTVKNHNDEQVFIVNPQNDSQVRIIIQLQAWISFQCLLTCLDRSAISNKYFFLFLFRANLVCCFHVSSFSHFEDVHSNHNSPHPLTNLMLLNICIFLMTKCLIFILIQCKQLSNVMKQQVNRKLTFMAKTS